MAERQEQQQVASDGDAAEWKQVAELRAVTQAQDPSCKVRPLSLFHDSIHPSIARESSVITYSHGLLHSMHMAWPCLNLNGIHNEHNTV